VAWRDSGSVETSPCANWKSIAQMMFGRIGDIANDADLHLDGRDLTDLPYVTRWAMLADLIPQRGPALAIAPSWSGEIPANPMATVAPPQDR